MENSQCIFCDINDKKIPANIIYEDDRVIAFPDINPQAATHILIIPKKHISTLNHLSETDDLLVGRLVLTAQQLAKKYELDKGYRVVMNCGEHGGQTVFHIHLHLLGGRPMQWPPG